MPLMPILKRTNASVEYRYNSIPQMQLVLKTKCVPVEVHKGKGQLTSKNVQWSHSVHPWPYLGATWPAQVAVEEWHVQLWCISSLNLKNIANVAWCRLLSHCMVCTWQWGENAWILDTMLLYYFVWKPVFVWTPVLFCLNTCFLSLLWSRGYGHVVRDHYTFLYNYAESEAPSSLYAPVPVYALFSSRCWNWPQWIRYKPVYQVLALIMAVIPVLINTPLILISESHPSFFYLSSDKNKITSSL